MFEERCFQELISPPSTESFKGNMMDCIIPPFGGKGGLYLGNKDAAMSLERLDQLKIRAVLTIDDKFDFDYFNCRVGFILRQISEHRHLKISDSLNVEILPEFEVSSAWIHRMLSVTNVLVHCHAGVSRSPTLVIAYLIQCRGLGLQASYLHVKQVRNEIRPNIKFVQSLVYFDEIVQKRRQTLSLKDQETESTDCSDTRSSCSI